MGDLAGKVAIITGASRGIGQAIAVAYAAAGARVALASRKQAELDAVANAINATGGYALAVTAHTGSSDAVERLIAQTLTAYGGIDIVVNNAATNPHFGPVLTAEESMWDKTLDVNVKGYWRIARACSGPMRERGAGTIINMASVAGTLGGFGQASYSTTKAGALGLTRTLAMEGARHGITCNAIVPGVIGTEAFNMANAAMNERIVARTVFKRPGEPQDIANAIAFLCSDLASYITGVGLYVSGGIELFVF